MAWPHRKCWLKAVAAPVEQEEAQQAGRKEERAGREAALDQGACRVGPLATFPVPAAPRGARKGALKAASEREAFRVAPVALLRANSAASRAVLKVAPREICRETFASCNRPSSC